MEILPRVVQKCIRHNLDFNVDKFTKAYNIKTYKNGYYPYCNTCIKNMLAQYIKNTGCLVGGFYYLCARLDIPFIKKVWDSIQDNPNHPVTPATVLDLYTKALNNKSLKRPFEIWDDFSCSDALNDVEEARKSKEQSEQELKDFIFNWGKQESEEDYEFLIYTFNRYAKNVEFVNPQQEDLYRDLCLARLEKRKAEQSNAPETDITKIQTRILNIMNKLHLDDFETTKPKSLSEQLIFNKIAMVEQNNSEELYQRQKKYEKESQVRRYIKDLVLRPVLNFVCGNKDYSVDIDDAESYKLDMDKN